MGAAPNLPNPLPPDASEMNRIAFAFQLPCRKMQILNDLTSQDLADMMGLQYYQVTPFFHTTERQKVPRGTELWKLFQATDKSGKKFRSTGSHGRVFNYVEFFEGQEYTQYERVLRDQLAEVTDEKNRIEIAYEELLRRFRDQ